MKIGFDVSQTGALKAGCGFFAHSLIEALTTLDAEKEYITYPAFGTRFWDPDHVKSTWRAKRPNIRRGPEGMSHAACIQMWQAGGDALDKALGFPDLVHANNFYCPRGLRARVVYTLYDLVSLDHPDFITEANRLVCADGLLDAAIHADMLVAISDATRTRFLELFPHYPATRIRTIYPASRFSGANPSLRDLPAGLQPDGYWLAVGTLEPRKNLRRLVRAYAALLREHPNAPPLVLAGGEGWLEDDFSRLVAGLGIAESVRRLGYVSDAVLAALYKHCFAFVYPSLVEGFGLPVLEAMSLGAAVVTSRTSSMPEITGDAALLVDPGDERSIETALRQMLTDSDARAALRGAAQQRAASFSWTGTARAVMALYEEVLERPAFAVEAGAA